jgi:lipoate-protein ligase A
MQFCVEGGVIREAAVYSDGMETDFISAIGEALRGVAFSSKDISRSLTELSGRVPVSEETLKDIIRFIGDNNF